MRSAAARVSEWSVARRLLLLPVTRPAEGERPAAPLLMLLLALELLPLE